jgi:hypothetical protein
VFLHVVVVQRKSDKIGSEFLQLEREKSKVYGKAIATEEYENPVMSFFKSLMPYMNEFTPLEKL